MNKEQLDAIANRKTTCHPFGETVSISRAERNELLQGYQDALILETAVRQALGFVSAAEQDYAPDGNLRVAEELLFTALASLRKRRD